MKNSAASVDLSSDVVIDGLEIPIAYLQGMNPGLRDKAIGDTIKFVERSKTNPDLMFLYREIEQIF